MTDHVSSESMATGGYSPSGFSGLEHQVPPLPEAYGEARLLCLVKDPGWIYCCWELLMAHIAQVAERSGMATDARKLIRVHRIEADQLDLEKEVEIGQNIGSWYINVSQPGCEYQVDIALESNGRYAVLLSTRVLLPPGRVSDVEDEHWATIDELYRQYRRQSEEAGSSPGYWGVFSPGLSWAGEEPQEAKPPGELIVTTELIIHGRATPGWTVTVSGEQVSTEEDGSFSLRYNLAEGLHVYPVKATDPTKRQELTAVPVIKKEMY